MRQKRWSLIAGLALFVALPLQALAADAAPAPGKEAPSAKKPRTAAEWKKEVLAGESPAKKALREELKGCKDRILFNRRACVFIPPAERKKKEVWKPAEGANWDIWAINADGGDLKNLTDTADADEIYAHASPDGTKFIYTVYGAETVGRNTKSKSAIWMRDMDGKNPKMMVDNAQHGCWTPDGKGITYTKNDPKRNLGCHSGKGIYTLDVATQKETLVSDKMDSAFCISWSPDMKHIAYFAKYTQLEGNQIWDVATGYRVGIYGCRTDWSPDGKYIAFTPNDYKCGYVEVHPENIKDGASESWCPATKSFDKFGTCIAKGTKEDGGSSCYFPDWSPDQKYIVYSRLTGEFAEGSWDIGSVGEWNVWVAKVGAKGPENTLVSVQVTFDENTASMEPDWAAAGGKNALQ